MSADSPAASSVSASTSGRVFVVGSINMDLVIRTPRLPQPGETLLGGPFRTFPGGKGANQAVASARFGAATHIIGCVGADAYGGELRATLESERIDITRVAHTNEHATGVALITVDETHGENTIIVAGGANLALNETHVAFLGDSIQSDDIVLMQLEIPLRTVTRAAQIAQSRGARVVLNAAPAQALPPELLASVDILIVNRTEAAIVAAMPDRADTPADVLASRLRELGVDTIIITLGGNGALCSTPGSAQVYPAASVTPVDTVGAGDAFAGVVAAALAQGQSLEDAMLLANAAGALATTKEGATPSLPLRDEVRTLAQSMKQ